MSFSSDNGQNERQPVTENASPFVRDELQGALGASFFCACASAALLAHSAEVESSAVSILGIVAFVLAIVIVAAQRRRVTLALAERLAENGVPADTAQRVAAQQVSFALDSRQGGPPSPAPLEPSQPAAAPLLGIEFAEAQSGLRTIREADAYLGATSPLDYYSASQK